MLTSLIAFTTPDGEVHIHKDYLSTHDLSTESVEDIEYDHYENLVEKVSENGIYRTDSQPQTSPRTIGFRKDATLRDDMLRRDGRGSGSRRRASNGRR